LFDIWLNSARCYTNHALDQFLEHLLDVGIDRILRIGGSSKSSRLEGKNLRVVAQTEGKSKSEGYLCAMTWKEIEGLEKPIQRCLKLLHDSRKRSWHNVKRHLTKNYAGVLAQFSKIDKDGYQKVTKKDPFETWLSDRSAPAAQDNNQKQTIQQIVASANRNINSLCHSDRSSLVDHWIAEIQSDLMDELYELTKQAETSRQELINVYDEVDRRVLQTAQVIGVTTTGLAKRIALLQHVQCRVIICEEAGEIMEPHFLTALLPTVEHVISIGDHQQLRPQINNFRLSLESQQGKSFQLDRSQFERLAVGEPGRPKCPVAQLNIQRRMRPQISSLIRPLYSDLIDHEVVKDLPDVVGLRENVFWLEHDNEESGHSDIHQKSHSNVWEVEMTYALLRHVVRQGVYTSRDIAVLTPYTGQLQKLRAKFRSEFEIVLSDRDIEALDKDGFTEPGTVSEPVEGFNQTTSGKKPLAKKQMSELLRLGTVDNFQGEEAKVIIVSLVRSNKNKKVGFLKTINRINVLLSRAQHGLYLIGNSETYSNIEMWKGVIDKLRAENAIGKAFNLCCPRHPETVIQVFQPDEFLRLSPEGGCQLICNQRLSDCGHQCLARCHSESMHEVFACPKPCQRLHHPCQHLCQKDTCGEDCGKCMVKVDAVTLPTCGHVKDNVNCYEIKSLATIKCSVLVPKQIPGCNHTVDIQCSEDVLAPSFKCPKPCESILPCGHLCPGSCGRCYRKDELQQVTTKHFICKKVCGRRFGTCNHPCPRPCHDDECGPCPLPCEVRCPHSKCTLKCSQACAPCVEKCTWHCEHQGSCSMPCAAPCERLPCNVRCTRTLACGHQCPSLCGETCPEGYCQLCSTKQESRVDLLEMKTYGEITLEESPIVVLGCGHFFTAESLDGMVGMSDVYEYNRDGDLVGLKDVSAELARAIPKCPDCNCSIRQFVSPRYNRIINRAVIDEMSKRFLVSGKDELEKLEHRIANLEKEFELSKQEIIQNARTGIVGASGRINHTSQVRIEGKLKERHAKASQLEAAIHHFRHMVSDRNQPAQKLYDAIIKSKQSASLVDQLANLKIAGAIPFLTRDRRITLGGEAIQAKAAYFYLTDLFAITQAFRTGPSGSKVKISGGAPEQLCMNFFKLCRTFIATCRQENLPKLAVETTLFFAKLARTFQMFSHSVKNDLKKAADVIVEAKSILEDAKELCQRQFQNADVLGKAVEETLSILSREWYEEVTPEEVAAIKVSNPHEPQELIPCSYTCGTGKLTMFCRLLWSVVTVELPHTRVIGGIA